MKKGHKLKFKRKMMPMSKSHKKAISSALMGRVVSEATKIKIGNANRGRKYGSMPKTYRENISKALKGRMPKFIPDNKGRKRTLEQIQKMLASRIYSNGNKHWNWQGGITPENMKVRKSLKMKRWRKHIFERDNFTCLVCHKKGGKLNADHIKPFSLYPELRFELSNGRTLCFDCHKLTDTYLSKIKKYVKSI